MRRELLRVGISDEWAELMLGRIEEWRRDGADRATAEASAHQKRLAEIDAKVARLLDVFLDGSITREEYAARKAEYFTEKTRLREKIDRIKSQGNCWIEPLADFVKAANLAQNTAISGSYAELREFFQRFQLNLFLERPEAGENEDESRMHPPSERSGQKSDPAARRGGLAARADLPTPQEPPRIASADPCRKSLYPSLKVRASRARRAAAEHPCQTNGVAAAPDLSAGKKWSSQRVSNRGNLPPRLCVEFVGPWKNWAEKKPNLKWSGRRDLNPRHQGPKPCALPG